MSGWRYWVVTIVCVIGLTFAAGYFAQPSYVGKLDNKPTICAGPGDENCITPGAHH